MNEKEIGEIRRRLRPEKNNITGIYGCYVNQKREIVSRFQQSLALASPEEAESLLALLRKVLSGSLGKNLLDISFETKQVADSDEHRLLMALRNSALKDGAALEAFYQKAAESLVMDGPYLILLAADTYDVFYRGKDGARLEDASSEVYAYFVCGVYPVKQSKPALRYDVPESVCKVRDMDWLVSSPEAGLLFPAFDDRSANIYNALYYTKNTGEIHPELIEAVFCREAPMPADTQEENFHLVLSESLQEDCNLDTIQGVRETLRDMVEEHKESKVPEPLTVSGGQMGKILAACGVEEDHRNAFEEKIQEEFGENAWLSPRNLMDIKRFKLSAPGVEIRVDPEHEDLVETRVIDGKKYILIRAEEGVELNGVPLRILGSL